MPFELSELSFILKEIEDKETFFLYFSIIIDL